MFIIKLNGNFETNDADLFLNKLQTILNETGTTFKGQMNSYSIDFVDFEEVKPDETSTKLKEKDKKKTKNKDG